MGIKVRALVEGVDQFIGIDHHKRRSQLLIKDREGRVVKRGNIVTSRKALSDFLGDGDGLVRLAVFEAGPRYRPLARWLRELVDQPLMANPSRLKIISETAYKDDKIDTEKLTDFSMLGLIPPAHICSDEAWDRRMLLRQRVTWVRMRTTVKNRIHSLVDLHPDAEPARPAVTDLFGLLGMAWLEAVELPQVDRRRLEQLLEGYRFLTKQIARSDREVRRIVKADRRCGWLKTIPGIGDFFAALIIAEIDDIGRFRKSKQFVSYTGLVPGRDQSDKRDVSRKIHKRGSKYLRWALVEAAIPATKSNLALKNLYDRVRAKRGAKAGPNVAKVAVARKLAEIVYRLLVEERPYAACRS
jgi:transposase